MLLFFKDSFHRQRINNLYLFLYLFKGDTKQSDLRIFEGYNLNLTCNFNRTYADKIQWTWFFNGSQLIESTIAKKIENATQSSIKINNLNIGNVGVYKCELKTGDEIIYSEEFPYVKFAGRYDSIWLFLGICIESVILCGAVFIYEKKFSKPIAYDDDDDDDKTREL